MPDLSACYFCGTALDEPLSEYPVVPKTLQPTPDQQRTVVLCSVCRRKLGKVVDSVLDAVDEASLDDTVQQGLPNANAGQSARDDDENTGGSKDPESAAETGEGWTSVEEMEQGTEAVGEETPAEESVDDDSADEAPEADQSGSSDDAPDVEFNMTPPPETGRKSDTDEASGDAEPDDSPDASTGVPATDGAGEGDDDEDPSLTALEYTKVMRLLENRDLPVDREEIRVVATNAYEIQPEEFDAVVEAAIDRGLIVEEDGQFVDIE